MHMACSGDSDDPVFAICDDFVLSMRMLVN